MKARRTAEHEHAGPEASRIEAVRRFNRFYTRRIGALGTRLFGSRISLTEARVLYEIAQRTRPAAAEIGRALDLDPGYLSRVLRDLRRRGWVSGTPCREDNRRSLLSLTDSGRRTLAWLEAKAREDVGAMLRGLSPASLRRVVEAMSTLEALLDGMGGAPANVRSPFLLRPHHVGDGGWVVHRHGALYAEEYGWNEQFEALVAEIVAKFLRRHDPQRERFWIAERDGEIVGSVLLVAHSKTVAKLRLLLVEPCARGLGIGSRLVEECVRFARQAGYRKVVLWTNDVLLAARRIYERARFCCVRRERHHSFGHDLVGETWELPLRPLPSRSASAPPSRRRVAARRSRAGAHYAEHARST